MKSSRMKAIAVLGFTIICVIVILIASNIPKQVSAATVYDIYGTSLSDCIIFGQIQESTDGGATYNNVGFGACIFDDTNCAATDFYDVDYATTAQDGFLIVAGDGGDTVRFANDVEYCGAKPGKKYQVSSTVDSTWNNVSFLTSMTQLFPRA